MQTELIGEWRKPVNTAANQKGGIHDDATATDLGFRGGTVAGSIHMEQFPPLLVELFGDDWWCSGTLSLYFKSATVDLEPVRCFISSAEKIGEIDRASVWMEKEDGTVIVSGTASCGGHDDQSELRQRLASIRPISELRMLSNLHLGNTCSPQPSLVTNKFVDGQLKVITEPMACYQSAEQFGDRVLPMTQIVRAFGPAEHVLAEDVKPPFVGLYGAIEIEYVNGPVFSETEYTASGQIAGLSDSPQTEILWRDMLLTRGDQPVARMLKMDRLMKDSSPLWK